MKGSPEYWEDRYQSGRTGWDRGRVSPALLHWMELGTLQPCRILVPGCGRGYEVVELAHQGYAVTALDFAPSPVALLRETLAARGLAARVIQADVLDWQPEEPVDAVYEQTCLCALPPSMRPAYAAQLARWLRPGGQLLALFMQNDREGGPPFHCALPDMQALFPAGQWEWRAAPFGEVSHPTGPRELAYELVRRPFDSAQGPPFDSAQGPG